MIKFRWMTPLLNADGDIGAPSGDQSSVETGAEASDNGIAPESGQSGEQQPDVTSQESFAARLRESREQIEQQYAPYRQHVTKVEQIAKGLGFGSVEEYLAAAETQLQERQAAEEAQRLGVDQETYNQFFAPVHSELQQTKAELVQLRQAELQRQIRSDIEDLRREHPDFDQLQDKVFELAGQRGLPIKDAYKLAAYDAHVNAAKLAGQQEALTKLSNNAQSATGAVGGDAPDQQFDFRKLSPDQRREYYEKAKRGELKSLR